MYKNCIKKNPDVALAYEVLKEIGPAPAIRWFADPRLERLNSKEMKLSIITALAHNGYIVSVDKTRTWAKIWMVR